MAKKARIALQGLEGHEEFGPLVLFLEIDAGGAAMVGQIGFGMWGPLNEPDKRYPLIILNDGTLDYGAYAATEDRYWEVDWEGPISVGARCTTASSGTGESVSYAITSISDW